VVTRLVDSWKTHRWFKKGKWFARGAYAKVFRKVESNYPNRLLINRGNVVKVICKSNSNEAKMLFFELKLTHFLFPDSTLNPKKVRFVPGFVRGLTEIHVDEVPVHRELAAYQRFLSKHQLKGYRRGGILHRACVDAQRKYGARALEISSEMDRAGVSSGIHDNPLNVSYANPKLPVFLDTRIIGPDYLHNLKDKSTLIQITQNARKKLLDFASTKDYSVSERRRFDKYLSLWFDSTMDAIKNPPLVMPKSEFNY